MLLLQGSSLALGATPWMVMPVGLPLVGYPTVEVHIPADGTGRSANGVESTTAVDGFPNSPNRSTIASSAAIDGTTTLSSALASPVSR